MAQIIVCDKCQLGIFDDQERVRVVSYNMVKVQGIPGGQGAGVSSTELGSEVQPQQAETLDFHGECWSAIKEVATPDPDQTTLPVEP